MDAQEVEPPLKRQDLRNFWWMFWRCHQVHSCGTLVPKHLSRGMWCHLLDSKIVGVSLHRSGQRSCSPFWSMAASCKGTEGWHAWVSKLQGLWSFFFWRMSKDQDLKSRGTTDEDGGRGCQWVPSIGVGYSWTRKGSQRMQFRQLLWLMENTRRAWLHWGRIYVVWPRRPSWSCFWKSFWAAL